MSQMTATRSLSLAAAVFAAAAALIFAFSATAQPGGAVQGDPVRGAILGETCLGCHAIAGHRNPFPAYHTPKLGGQHPQAIYDALVGYRSRQRSHTTMFAQAGSLSDQDARDIAAWFGALGGPQTGTAATGAQIQRGQQLAAACAGCHGPQGISPNGMFPNLAGQHEDYLLHALRQYATGGRTNVMMVPMAQGLSEQDMRDLAAFFAAQVGLYTPDL